MASVTLKNYMNLEKGIPLNQTPMKESIDCTPQRKVFTRYQHFKKMKQYNLDQPCIRISSKYEGSAEEISRREEINNKKFWVTNRPFSTTGSQKALVLQEKTYIKNYVTRTPSNPAVQHEFRPSVDKTKFVAKKDFRVV
jgi:hypothetical protein